VGKIVQIVGLQSVLVLRAAETAANGEVLDGLQKKHSPGHMRTGLANAADHLVGAEFSLVERL